MAHQQLHLKTIENRERICRWFSEISGQLSYPIYSSYDIRDAGYKIANVDANIYPAGFNNICPADKESSVELMKNYVSGHYGAGVRKILLVTEEHTQNPYYWENVSTILGLMEQAGFQVKIGFAKELSEPIRVQSSTGREFIVESAMAGSKLLGEFQPHLIVSNNDFSDAHEEWARSMTLPVNPPRELGWYQRKKSRYFKHYNALVNEFSEIAGIDPFLLRVETEVSEMEVENESSRKQLAEKVDSMLSRLQVDYAKRGIQQKPFVFVKNNAGTYGLAVIRIGAGKEIEEMTYKARKKMKAAKGGRDVEEVVIQEGIPSIVKADDVTAEPVIYMLGCELAGGFLRTHAEKSGEESLNSPGAVYKRLCVSDLSMDPKGCPKENVYGWSAKLGLLAIGLEGKEMGVEYKNYIQKPCGA